MTSAPVPTRMVLTPGAAAVDTSATTQFQSAVSWSDSAQHPAQVTYTATGGTISSAGLYHSGAQGGQFRVVAICDCGLTDTAIVTVAAQQTAATRAILTVVVSGLPVGAQAAVTVTGPGGYSRVATGSLTLDSLLPGDYSVQAGGVTAAPTSYTAAPSTQPETLAAGDNKNVQVTYSAVPSTDLPPHPRVWMTPARLVQLKAQAAANTHRWQVVKQAADASLAKGAHYDSADEFYLPALCAVYLGTGNQAYATRAGVIMAASANETNLLQDDSGYAYRFNLPDFIMGLDWCYAGLTVPQRQQTATWLMNRADWVWPETNSSRVNGWGLWPSNNYYWGFMMTGPAALAAAGDDTGTNPISGTNRPAYHRALAMTHWNSAAVPYFLGEGAGGAWDEGTGYGVGSAWYLGRFTDAFATAGAPISNDWLTAAVEWMMESTMPGGVYKAPLGDQARESTASEYAYDRAAMLDVLASVSGNSQIASQVQYWLNWIGNVPTSETGTAVATDELIHYNPAQSVAADLSGLPKDYLSAGPGYFVYRQSWTDPASTVMVFQAGSVGDGHNSLNGNGLMIWKGSSWISATGNIYSQSGIENGTANYDNLTIGDSGQVLYGGNDARITDKQVSDQLVVLRGQAGNTYGHPPGIGNGRNVATDYARTVAYLPQQDAFVIVDRATAVLPSQQKVWRWQMQGTPQVSGNTFTLANPTGNGYCAGSVLLPTNAVIGTQTFNLGLGGATSSHAVTVSIPTGHATDLVVTVLQCSSTPVSPVVATVTDGASETDVTVGSTQLAIPHDETQAVHLQ
ncbi:MAG TPA: hypothetical protein VGL65_07940 [Gemmatimonadales bacterium]